MSNPIIVSSFLGVAQAIEPRLLNAAMATEIADAEPQQGDLLPLRQVSAPVATVPTGAQRLTIYREGLDTPNDAASWMQWTTRVNVVRSNDGNDTTDRIYFTGSGTPKWTDNNIGLSGGAPYPQATRELSVPAPASALTAALNTNGSSGTDEYRVYVHTFVNDLGWESAPSPISNGVTCKPGALIDLTGLPAPPSGSYGITLRRIYRTQPTVTDGAASYYFLREIAVATTSTQDDSRALKDVVATVDWRPLEASAHSLIGLWGGMLAAAYGKTLKLCVPNAPYAWPIAYENDVFDTIVALGQWQQQLLVLTTGRSTIFAGDSPANMNEIPGYAGAPCMAARSVVSFDHGVVWASSDGLAYTGTTDFLTTGLLKSEQWKALIPSSMVAAQWGRYYVCSYNDGSLKGFIIDPQRPQDGIWFLSAGFHAAFFDKLAGKLYVLVGTAIGIFADPNSARGTSRWKSKVFRQANPRNFGYAKIVATSYPVTLKVWADAVNPVTKVRTLPLRATKTVAGPDSFTLPAGFTSEDWQFEVSCASGGAVQAVIVAASPQDLRGAS